MHNQHVYVQHRTRVLHYRPSPGVFWVWGLLWVLVKRLESPNQLKHTNTQQQSDEWGNEIIGMREADFMTVNTSSIILFLRSGVMWCSARKWALKRCFKASDDPWGGGFIGGGQKILWQESTTNLTQTDTRETERENHEWFA